MGRGILDGVGAGVGNIAVVGGSVVGIEKSSKMTGIWTRFSTGKVGLAVGGSWTDFQGRRFSSKRTLALTTILRVLGFQSR